MLRTALLAALLGLPITAAVAEGTPPEADAWLPLEVGRTWTYDYRRERSESSAGSAPENESFRGTLHDRVKGPAAEFGPSTVEVISSLRGRTAGGGSLPLETRRAFLEPRPSGYRIHALDAVDPIVGVHRLTRYDPPLEQLRVGSGTDSQWVVGTVDLGGLKTRLEAHVVGIEDVDTPSGRYEGCLVVRYEAELEGSFEVYGGSIDVTDGKVVVTEWFSRGVGLVRSNEDVEQSLRLPDGSIKKIREQTRYSLLASGREEPSPASR
jgi:hypothetical protein